MVVPSETGTPSPYGMVHIESVLTVTPGYPTGMPEPRLITWDDGDAASLWEETLQSRTQLVLFYKEPMMEDEAAGWTLAERFNESLRVALMEHPVLAGRIRRPDSGRLEIQCTDSGIRLVQAKAEGVAMSEFMCPEARDNGLEAQLFYWTDINVKDIEFSPLLYVQLTIFPREGYSVGISSSLWLTDPLPLSNFLKTWSQTHCRMLSENKFYGAPIFHLSRKQTRGGPRYLDNPTPRGGPKNKTKFFVLAEAAGAGGEREPKAADFVQLASCCAAAALEPVRDGGPEGQTVPVSALANDASRHLKLSYSGIDGSLSQHLTQASSPLKLASADWKELLGIDEVKFREELIPVHSSCHLESEASGGLVVIMPTDNNPRATVLCAIALPVAACSKC